ncbi:hypothetical protein [Methanolobus sp.]|uniref:hypothetical protein n=1 Tax=Methanolobus sp. TaxID=1874737 RepID=UPI0025F909C2|nr:hypothetical protein [Methanolobus sp.]
MVGVTFLLYLLDFVSFGKGTFIFISVLGIDAVFLMLTDDDLDIGRTIGAIIGFAVGIVLTVTISPITTPIGIAIIAFTAFKLGWLGENMTTKFSGN